MSEIKRLTAFLLSSLAAGMLIVVPIYLSVLLLLRAMQAVGGLVRPLAQLLPQWLPAEQALSLLLVLLACLLIGVGCSHSNRARGQQPHRDIVSRKDPWLLTLSESDTASGGKLRGTGMEAGDGGN